MRSHLRTWILILLMSWQPMFAQTVVTVQPPGPATAPGRSGPIVMGLDLSLVPLAGRERDLPDLFAPRPDEATPQRYSDSVFALDLDQARQARLIYFPSRQHYYIKFQPHTISADLRVTVTEPYQLYGPIEGDPFHAMKLDDWLRMKASGRNSQPYDAKSAMRSMIANGDAALAMHGLQLMEVFMDLSIPLSIMNQYVMESRRLIDAHGERIKRQALAEQLASATAKLEHHEAELDKITIELGPEYYTKAADVKPAPPASIPAENWGPISDGVRAAVIASNDHPGVGEAITISVVLENASDRVIKMHLHRRLNDTPPRVKRPDGRWTQVQGGVVSTGFPRMDAFWLDPGERVIIESAAFSVGYDHRVPRNTWGYKSLEGGPGEYQIGYIYTPQPEIYWERSETGDFMRVKGEWHGTITTGEARLQVQPAQPTVGP